MRQGGKTTDAMRAIEQIENAAYWINHDALMAQTISPSSGSGFSPLALSWQDIEGNTNQISYTLATNGELQRTLTINGVPTDQRVAAKNIVYDATKTKCSYSSDVLTFQAAANVGSNTQTRSYQIKLRVDQPSAYLTITSTVLSSGKSNTPYNENLTAAGGTEPYHWTQTGGTLPPLLSLSSAGVISGTPIVGQCFSVYHFTVQVTDSNNLTASDNLTIMINPLNIDTSSLPSGKKAKNYGSNTPNYPVYLAASGGTTIYTWSWSASSASPPYNVPPPGLTLNTSTGLIYGMPDNSTGGNDYLFSVILTDSDNQTARKNLSIHVAN
jgi:hypothetical protein